MKRIPITRNRTDIIALGDEWVRLMAVESYEEAYALTDHDRNGWTPKALGEVIKAYGVADPNQLLTLEGRPTDVTQTKDVTWWDKNDWNCVGQLWYDLNIDGSCTDLTATFNIIERDNEMYLQLSDVHVM